MDTNEKTQSKFPRSSLRARNKTIMMAPADVQDFSPTTDREELSLDDVFDEPDFGAAAETSPKGETLLAVDQPLVDEIAGAPGVVQVGSPRSEVAGSDPIGDAFEGFDPVEEPLVSKPTIFDRTPPAEPEESAAPSVTTTVPMARIVRASSPEAPPAPLVEPQPVDLFEDAEAQPWEVEEQRAQLSEPLVEDTKESLMVKREGMSRQPEEHMARVTNDGEATVVWKKPSKIVGFLVSFSADPLGTFVELREGRLLVSSELTEADNCLVINNSTVSAMHAIMRISGDGSILILDQLSEHGTRIRRGDTGVEESLMGEKSHLNHGDVVIFGECEYSVCTLGKGGRSS